MVWTPAEDARPSATEAAAKVQTKREEEEARRDFFAVGGSHQQRQLINSSCLLQSDPHISVHPKSLLYLTSQIVEGVYFLKCLAFQCDGWLISCWFSDTEHLGLLSTDPHLHRVQALSRTSSICCSSFLVSATRVRSSAYTGYSGCRWSSGSCSCTRGTIPHWWCTQHADRGTAHSLV